jgi:hypothetical protein
MFSELLWRNQARAKRELHQVSPGVQVQPGHDEFPKLAGRLVACAEPLSDLQVSAHLRDQLNHLSPAGTEDLHIGRPRAGGFRSLWRSPSTYTSSHS